jgi:hypothetical protein
VRQTGATFQPSQLPPGNHFLYVRAVDDGGLVTNLVLPLLVVHPAFKDPGAPRSILFVDDSIVQLGNGSGPTDPIETQWWTERGPTGHGPLIDLFDAFGVSETEWDTFEQGLGSVEGRKQPDPAHLAPFTTVVWTTDASNSGSLQTALFKTVAGGDYSELQGYLRAGGTLILTGWDIAQNTSGRTNDTFKSGGPAPNGICGAFAPGSADYDRTTFARFYMGIDNSAPNQEERRAPGDPTPKFKWNTNAYPPPFNPDQQLFPGLSGIEGWYMATNFGCQPIQNFAVENPAAPVVQRIYTYHGVRQGALLDGGPSPREGLVVGELVQAHDLGTSGGQSHYTPTAAVGRIAVFTFPLYFLKDADAINIMTKSFGYVNASPTLP